MNVASSIHVLKTLFCFPADWQTYLNVEIPKWLEFYNDWLSFTGPKLLLFYEEMKSDLKSSLRQLCEFLNVTQVCSEERIECVVENSAGNFKRAGSVVDNTAYFTREQMIRLETDKDLLYSKLTDCVRDNMCVRYVGVWPIGIV